MHWIRAWSIKMQVVYGKATGHELLDLEHDDLRPPVPIKGGKEVTVSLTLVHIDR